MVEAWVLVDLWTIKATWEIALPLVFVESVGVGFSVTRRRRTSPVT